MCLLFTFLQYFLFPDNLLELYSYCGKERRRFRLIPSLVDDSRLFFKVSTGKLCHRADKPGECQGSTCEGAYEYEGLCPMVDAAVEQVFRRSVLSHLRQHVLDEVVKVVFQVAFE